MSTGTINKNSGSQSQGINREQKIAVESSDQLLSSDKSTKLTSQATVAPDLKAERPRVVERKPTSKPAVMKREQSNIFKSFSKPKAKLKQEDTGSSSGASPVPDSADSVSTLSLAICNSIFNTAC